MEKINLWLCSTCVISYKTRYKILWVHSERDIESVFHFSFFSQKSTKVFFSETATNEDGTKARLVWVMVANILLVDGLIMDSSLLSSLKT